MLNIIRTNSLDHAVEVCRGLSRLTEPVAVDIETTGLSSFTDSLLSIALADNYNNVWILAAEHAQSLLNLDCPLVLHNFKFDFQFLFRNEIDLYDREVRDTMLMHNLLDENAAHSLDSLVQTYYKDNYKEVFWNTYKTFNAAPHDAQDLYAAKDAHYTLKLYYDLSTLLTQDEIPESLIAHVHRFAWHLSRTEVEGVNVDLDYLADKGLEVACNVRSLEGQLREGFSEHLNSIEEELYAKEKAKRKTEKGKAGVPRPIFNFDSNQQLQTLLYERLGLPVQKNSARKVTTDDAALAVLGEHHEGVSLLRDYREQRKLFTAFFEATLERLRKGCIYPSFNVNGTVTGRTASSNPNLQQLPASGGVRGIYHPRPGYVFVSADYGQLEVTLAAHFSRDSNLLKVVLEGASLHDITAAALGIERKTAKTVNFAVQYGAGTRKIQKILGCDESTATKALEKYWRTYPGLHALVKRCHSAVDLKAPIVNPFGRQRRLLPENPKDKWSVEGCKRQAFNSLIQGTGADITNNAFRLICDELLASGEGRGLFVVHDEIIIEVLEATADYWNKRLGEVMVDTGKVIDLSVPLTVECSGAQVRWVD